MPCNILGYHLVWRFRFVAVMVCGRFSLWPFRFVAVMVCGPFGLWPFRFVAFRFVAFQFVAVSVCGRFSSWPLWPVTALCISGDDRFSQWPPLCWFVVLLWKPCMCYHALPLWITRSNFPWGSMALSVLVMTSAMIWHPYPRPTSSRILMVMKFLRLLIPIQVWFWALLFHPHGGAYVMGGIRAIWTYGPSLLIDLAFSLRSLITLLPPLSLPPLIHLTLLVPCMITVISSLKVPWCSCSSSNLRHSSVEYTVLTNNRSASAVSRWEVLGLLFSRSISLVCPCVFPGFFSM